MKLLLNPILLVSLTVLLSACTGGTGDDSGSTDQDPSDGSSNTGSEAVDPISDIETPIIPEDSPTLPAMRSVTLTWTTPASRADGNPLPLTEIGGYEVYYFMEGASESEGQSIIIEDPAATQFTTPVLPSGTYYFAIASYDINGLYSDLSEYITTTLP